MGENERTTKTVELAFGTKAGGTKSLSIPGPKDGLGAIEARSAALQILNADPFDGTVGGLESIGRITVVTRTVRKVAGFGA